MVLWAKNATKFVVSVSFIPGAGSSYGCVPKPVLEKLGNPKAIRYEIKGDRVTVSNADPPGRHAELIRTRDKKSHITV